MNKIKIAKRYSRSLISTFNITDIKGVIEGLQTFSKVINANRELKLLFVSPIFSDEEKERALKTLLSHLKIPQQTERFLKNIIIQGHVSAIKEIIKALIDAYNERLKKMTALVISPVVMERAHVERLKRALDVLTQRDIDIESELDPSLLGGFIVKVGNTIYDNTLKGQLQLLRAQLTK